MISAINRELGLYCDPDGFVHPVIGWFRDGEDCAPEDATGAFAGTEGRWFPLDLREFG